MAWALHQLDQDTSGLMLFATHKRLVALWQAHWSSSALQKIYVALVHGRLPRRRVLIDAPLARARRSGSRPIIISPEGRPAQTEAIELTTTGSYSLIAARLITGRTHQIRAHLEHIGTPLLGEATYNSIPCGFHPRQALHALAITSSSPLPALSLEAPLAADLLELAARLDLYTDPLQDWRTLFP